MFKGYKRSIPKPWDFLVSLTIIHHTRRLSTAKTMPR